MSHENWLIASLTAVVILILALSSALCYLLGWSHLSVATLVLFLSYPLVWLSWRCYKFWRDSIMHLTTYSQTLREGSYNVRFKAQHKNNLLFELQQEIVKLANSSGNTLKEKNTTDNILSRVLDTWPVPVCLFDDNYRLIYRNQAMVEQLKRPLLVGSSANEVGFTELNGQWSHVAFPRDNSNANQTWQTQTIQYTSSIQNNETKHWLFTAFNVTSLLQQKQSITQQNLVRVLSHELRNSLTPMFSMTDTLLGQEQLPELQTRKVLTRIQQRSKRLLSFIDEYAKLSQLPEANFHWFSLRELVEEAKAMAPLPVEISFCGNAQCYADSKQLAQVFINLFKNAAEACTEKQCKISITAVTQSNMQIITVIDNGPGFANLQNVLTPFYTTKPNGSGIGLAFCAEIVSNHGGQFKVANIKQDHGAKITITLPF